MTSSATVSKWLFIRTTTIHLPGSIIGRGDEAFILLTVVNRLEGIRHLIKALEDVTQKVDSRVQLHFRVLSLHSGGADGNVNALGADRMVPGHHRHVDIYEIRRRRFIKGIERLTNA